VEAGLGAERRAEVAMGLGVVPLVREHRADAGHDGEGGQEQPLEQEGVVDVGGRRRTGDGHPIARGGEVVLGPALAPVGRVGVMP
jgi:hypothetical protein